MAIGTVIGAIGAAASAAAKKKQQTTKNPTVGNAPKTAYDSDTNYQALINAAQGSGNMSLARQYEAQRNAKIADLNAQGTNVGGYQQTNYYQPLNLPEYKPYSGNTPELNMPEYKPFDYKSFNYNAENDDIYKQYAEQFARQGQSAGERSLAGAAAATGGIASSYAAAANAQAQQAYAQKTADMIPQLEQNAYNRYLGERNFSYQDYLNQYNLGVQRAQSMYDADWRNTDFSYQDYLNQYNARVDRSKAMYDSEMGQRDFNYQNYINNLDNTYRQSAFDWQKETDARDFDYRKVQDALQNVLSQSANARQWAQFNYNKEQDALSRQEREEQKKNEQRKIDFEANYPNTVMGQLEARTNEAQEAEIQNNIRAAVSSALQAPNAAQWLKENAAYLSDNEYTQVIKILKDYGTISKQQGE